MTERESRNGTLNVSSSSHGCEASNTSPIRLVASAARFLGYPGTAGSAQPFVTRTILIGLLAAALVALWLGSALARGKDASARAGGAAMLFMSPTGSNGGPCTRAEPCATFARAYRLARPGAVVELAAGTYGASDQHIPADTARQLGPQVVFRPARGAAVTVTAELQIDASWIRFERMRFAGGWTANGDHLTFRSISAADMFLHGSDIRVLGGEVYPGTGYTGEDDPLIASRPGGSAPTNVLIDGVWFHGWLRAPGSGSHTECLQAGAGVDVVIRRSRFSDCATHDIFIRSWGTLNGSDNTLRNWVLENNFFGQTADGYYSLQLSNDLDETGRSTGFVLRNNSWAQSIHIDVRDGTKVQLIGNVGEQYQWSCNSSHGDVVWSHNVFTAARCSATDRRAPSAFVDPARLDLRLKKGAAALNRGDPSDFPSVDIFGHRRPRGKKPDAGAVEAG